MIKIITNRLSMDAEQYTICFSFISILFFNELCGNDNTLSQKWSICYTCIAKQNKIFMFVNKTWLVESESSKTMTEAEVTHRQLKRDKVIPTN